MATRMLQRRGTAAEWTAANPVLAAGEIGFETDTYIIKVGDGTTAWNDIELPYLPTGGGNLTGNIDFGGNVFTNLGNMVEVLNMGNFAIENIGDWTEPINMGGHQINNVANPTADTDALNLRTVRPTWHAFSSRSSLPANEAGYTTHGSALVITNPQRQVTLGFVGEFVCSKGPAVGETLINYTVEVQHDGTNWVTLESGSLNTPADIEALTRPIVAKLGPFTPTANIQVRVRTQRTDSSTGTVNAGWGDSRIEIL